MPFGLEYLGILPEELQNKFEAKERPIDIIHSEMNNILRDARKVFEGAAGIIIKIEFEKLSEKIRQALDELGVHVDGEVATKLLKVYTPGAASREFRMQSKAYDILEEANHLEASLAKIPKPLFYDILPLEEEVSDNLRTQGLKLDESNQVELIFMDWIPGVDLLTQMYKKIIEYFPEHLAQPDNIDDFDQLRYAVAIMLGFEVADTRNVIDPAHRESNENETFRRNTEKVYKFLKRKNLKFNPKLVDQLEKALKVLHKGGLWHNDLHERNFDVVGDIFDKNADIHSYIIDFGTATESASEMVVSDSDLIDKLKKADQIDKTLTERLYEVRSEIRDSKRFKEVMDSIIKASKVSPLNGIQASYALFSQDDLGFKAIIALEELLNKKLVSKEDVKLKMTEILDSKDNKQFSRRKNLIDFVKTLN